MQKINLEALESKNMTVATEDTLSEINGGCTMHAVYFCGKTTWTDFVSCCGSADCTGPTCCPVSNSHKKLMKKVFNEFRGDFNNFADMSVTDATSNDGRDLIAVSAKNNNKVYTYYYPYKVDHNPFG